MKVKKNLYPMRETKRYEFDKTGLSEISINVVFDVDFFLFRSKNGGP